MTINSFYYLVGLAKRLGITTIGELAEYKKARGIKTNDDLLIALESECAV